GGKACGHTRRPLAVTAGPTPRRAYYLRQPQGRRLFDLKLSGAGLALCGASSPEDQALIDAVLAEHGPTEFARHFLTAKGLTHVDPLFDAFRPER
ncbi:MAG: conjugal transfer protein TrbE, partial [Brevundimonas sp.]